MLVLAGIAAIAFLVPIGDDPEPVAVTVFPSRLEPTMSYVPMPDRERAAFESSFAETIGAVDTAVRTIEVKGGSTSVGVRVVSMVMAKAPKEQGRQRLFATIDELVPFGDQQEQRWNGKHVWVHADDEILSSSVVLIDGRRIVIAYGGLLTAERAVIELLLT
ncbi:MAG: hypothetical protein QOG87_3658 [Actinomycetota bacterium]